METGIAVSGTAHAALIVWVVVGGSLLAPKPAGDIEFTEITLISEADLVSWASTAPETAEIADITTPPPPDTAGAELPEDNSGPTREQPLEIAAATPDQAPNARPERLRPPEPEVESPPGAPVEPNAAPGATLIDTPTPGGAPRKAPRVAPVPTLAPPDNALPDPSPNLAIRPDDAPSETPLERRPETAPEEAARQIVTEADDTSDALQTATAPTRSRRPVARPRPPAAPANVPPTPVPRTIDTAAALAAILGEDAAAVQTRTANTAIGPSLSGGHREAIRAAVGQCWNVGALSAEASRTKVTLGFSMSEAGIPLSHTIKLVSSEGGGQSAVDAAFQAARRAVVRCARGFDLPRDRYELWRDIELTFNPDDMRTR